MDFQFSRLFDPSEYESQALAGCFDGIALREHHNKTKEDIGVIRAHDDWRNLVQPIDHYKGSLAAKFSFNSISIPECIPDRLEIVAYANEFAFIFDGVSVFQPFAFGRSLNWVRFYGKCE